MSWIDGSLLVFLTAVVVTLVNMGLARFWPSRADRAAASKDSGDALAAYQEYYVQLIADLRREIDELKAKVHGLEAREVEREDELLRARAKIGEYVVKLEKLQEERDAAVTRLAQVQATLGGKE